MAQDEYGNEIDEQGQQQQQQGTTSAVAAQYNPGQVYSTAQQNAQGYAQGPTPQYSQAGDIAQGPAPQNQSQQGNFDRTAFRDQSMSRQVGQTAADFIASHPEISGGVRLVPGSNDKVILPTGEVIDLSINANAQGSGTANGWTGIGDWQNGQVVAYPGEGGGGAGFGGGGSGGAGGGGFVGGMGDKANTLFDLLMSRAQQSKNIDRNDPLVRAQSDAYNAQGQQARRDFLAHAAEKGGPYGNIRSETRRSAEELGKSSGAFEAQAIKQEQDARRSEIENALSGATGFLTEQQRMALQKELQQLQLQQQESQFGRSLAQNESQFGRNLGQRAYEYDTHRFDDMFL